ncbi:MAG: hypothetical protein A3K19_26895 [Lentisphaerae bacterium RIFOXYB12_FULL_65_16]|nr:MAG: hypothetical protein A3K18_23870 [Lentisphaerae bacterium RIFOXYA12_64_32]OGV88027.1 MAG: hypothetical protein A3K19_26895 [Lentisphaerae bacterium RIFOXYB12_FULL_65_16]
MAVEPKKPANSSRERHREYRKERGFFGQRGAKKDGKDETGKGDGKGEKQGPKKGSVRPYLRRYAGIVLQYRGYVVLLCVLSLIGVGLRALLPWTSKFMIDFVLVRGEMLLLYATCAALLMVAFTDIIISTINDYTSRLLSNKLRVHVRRLMIHHLQVLPLKKLDKLKTGGVISRLESDVSSFADLLYQGLLTPLSALLMFIVAIGSLAFISVPVTLACCVFCVIMFGLAYVVFNWMRPLFRDIREDVAKISGRLAETFGGIRVVRCFGREWHESREFITAHHVVVRKDLHTVGLDILMHRSFYFVYWSMNIAIWACAGYMIIKRGSMTIGEVVVFVSFIHWFFQPVFMIMHSMSQLQNSIACMERIFDLLDEEIDLKDTLDARPVDTVREGLRFDKVSFAYESDKPVLHEVNFTLEAGRTVAMVGPSGAGKSTVTNLLVRLYDVTGGQVLLDGTDIRKLRLVDYRGLFSLVLQDVFLFDGTVAENIAYSLPDATEAQIIEAAKASHAHEFVEAFPDKYNTLIGERGVKLSGGQKQRVSLARAILRDPKVLVLDEATSSLDSESEALIQEALKRILKDRTTLVIAHRLSTVMDADKIIVIDQGRIVEEGKHSELLERKGKYCEMFTKQMEKARGSAVFLDWDAANGAAGEAKKA